MLLLAAVTTTSVAHAQAPACKGNKAGKYKVKIDSAPPGATIYIESKQCPSIGVTPWTGKLTNATYSVIIEAPGYEPATKNFVVAKKSKQQALFVPLVRQPQIEINPSADKNLVGATVSVDGVSQGVVQGPMIIKTSAARHLIEIKKEGFETLTQWVDLSSQPSLVLTPQLKENPKPKFGVIVIEADVQDAEVYIDGNKHPDNTPSVINNVIEGVHVIEVRKPPAPPWRQTVQVTANQQTKVRAEIAALANAGVGVVRVISDTAGARAFLDGNDMGPVPIDIKDVKVGEHIVQVKAPGFQTGERKVTVAAGGSQIVKIDLNNEAGDQGTIKVVSNVPEAEVFIDGAAVGKVPQEKKLSAGEHPVVVRLTGYKEFSQNVRIEAGQSITVQAELKSSGRLRILSTPAGADVKINGITVGKTPFEGDVDTGVNVVRVSSIGYMDYEETVTVEGGKTSTISRELALSTKSETELQQEQRGLSSFGARALPRGRSTVDIDGGYPYFLTARITVGAGRLSKQFGAFDATIAVRTFLARSELGLGGRAMIADKSPFSAGLFANLWWGSKLFDDSQRNGATFEAGALVSLTALSNATITGRGYFQVWSDRHCPEIEGSGANTRFKATDPTDMCVGYLNRRMKNQTAEEAGFSDDDVKRVEDLTNQGNENTPQDFFTRDAGARFIVSIIGEIAVDQRWNLYGILEGAPFQGRDERALFTSLFSGPMAETDYLFYARVGLTYKF